MIVMLLNSNSTCKKSINTKIIYVFKYPDVAETLSTIHDKYVVVLVYKVSNNIVILSANVITLIA